MPSEPYAKAQPGDKLTIHAAAWNRVIDMVKPQASMAPGEEFSYYRTNFRVRCKNNTSTGIPRWGVLQISDVLESPDVSSSAFETWPSIEGIVPGSYYSDPRPYVIAVEPIPPGSIGQVAIAGVVQSRVLVRCTGHLFAKPIATQTEYLETSNSGPFRILWKGATGPANPTGVTGPTKPWSLLAFDYSVPFESLDFYATGSIQMLGHGQPTTGSSGCDNTMQWYSITECSPNPSYSSSYFL